MNKETTMESRTTRRAPAPAAPVQPASADAQIRSALERWKALHAERRALPDTGDFDAADKLFTVEERAFWDQIDHIETQVHDLPATTPAGVACKLWIAIPHNTTDAEPEAAAFRTDLEWFETQGEHLDWNLRCIVSALVSLKSMEA
jgi:hypothetical protein